MNKVILCEGKTDAILLSYYLGKMCNWQPVREKLPKELQSLDIRGKNKSQYTHWYKNGEDSLLICAVDGCNNFANFYRENLKEPIFLTDAFHKLVVITDSDNNDDNTITDRLHREFDGEIPRFEVNQWVTYRYQNSFGKESTLELLLIIIPMDKQGALETVLLDAISEDAYNKVIVDKCMTFVDEIRPMAERYITSDRLALKSKLGTTFAIQSPEKVFDFIDKQLQEVSWEESRTLRECFEMLEGL